MKPIREKKDLKHDNGFIEAQTYYPGVEVPIVLARDPKQAMLNYFLPAFVLSVFVGSAQ